MVILECGLTKKCSTVDFTAFGIIDQSGSERCSHSSFPASAHLIVAYLTNKNQFFIDSKCPLCNKMIPAEDVEVHFVMCLTKPRVTYNGKFYFNSAITWYVFSSLSFCSRNALLSIPGAQQMFPARRGQPVFAA